MFDINVFLNLRLIVNLGPGNYQINRYDLDASLIMFLPVTRAGMASTSNRKKWRSLMRLKVHLMYFSHKVEENIMFPIRRNCKDFSFCSLT